MMKTAAERYDEAKMKATDYYARNYVYGGSCPALQILLRQYQIAAIEGAVAEVRAEEEEKRLRWRRNVEASVNAQIDETWARGKAEGVAEERARWLAWATDLGFDRQEIPAEVNK